MITAGIDAGSRAIKIALFDTEQQAVIALGTVDQGVAQKLLVVDLYDRLVTGQGLRWQAIHRVIATGYGRGAIDLADTTITEITCHAAGVRFVAPDTATIIEIGGQDSKLLRLQENGTVRDFVMNDRCAAGTGRFLEMAAQRLETPLEMLGMLAAQSHAPARINSTCVVFAETEIIGLLASGADAADILAGIQAAVATRVAAMTGGRVTPPVYFTGGVALIPGMREALAAALDVPIAIADPPLYTGAIGAALLAARG
ncbi:MAG TPA: acyl-CoA dehydratase activase [Armatimonadota bacterium]|jgi:predicted CoA-substrate-specific enzyme activase